MILICSLFADLLVTLSGYQIYFVAFGWFCLLPTLSFHPVFSLQCLKIVIILFHATTFLVKAQGRKELISILKRTKYKEMMLATLEKKQLRYSPMDIRFHIRDLIGSGLLKTAQTATGIVVRISKD